MKTLILLTISTTLILAACTNEKNEIKHYQEEAIAIHDEIMPQISTFDVTTVKIDSILTHLAAIKRNHTGLDTSATRQELSQLKSDLEDATDHMMTWMKEYNTDTSSIAYYQNEIEKVKEMKAKFEKVAAASKEKLQAFN